MTKAAVFRNTTIITGPRLSSLHSDYRCSLAFVDSVILVSQKHNPKAVFRLGGRQTIDSIRLVSKVMSCMSLVAQTTQCRHSAHGTS